MTDGQTTPGNTEGLKPGDAVAVLSGPFRGLRGVVSAIDADAGRAACRCEGADGPLEVSLPTGVLGRQTPA